jgi:hypothetical protein
MRLSHRLSSVTAILGAALFFSADRTSAAERYEVRPVDGKPAEQQCFCDGRHFLTIVDDRGALAIRPHPGVDVNGWGTSLYLQPFLPGAVLGHSTARTIAIKDGVRYMASGAVSQGLKATYGTWNATLDFRFDPARKQITARGEYAIALDGPLRDVGDLNLLKIASNYLAGVPLLSGGVGNTGDMAEAVFVGDGFKAAWNPSQRAAFCPQERLSRLSITVRGADNVIDTAKLSQPSIAAAVKPDVSVTLTPRGGKPTLTFAAMYDTTKGKDFWQDNIGITPLVLRQSRVRRMTFDVSITSTAIRSDGRY